MWSRRIQIGCGASLLVALMLICAFSFGIYLGERGIARGAQAQTRSPNAANPGVAGTPDVIGTLEFYGDNTLTVTTAQGPRTIGLNEKTVVRRGAEAMTATFADLRPGVGLAIWGDAGGKRRELVARVIVIFPPNTPAK